MRRAGVVLYPGNPMVSTLSSTGAINSSHQPYGVNNSQYGQMNQYGSNPYNAAYNPYNSAAF